MGEQPVDAELLHQLLALREREWVEFKVNNADPEQTGKTLSAVANSAALHNEKHGYMVWGVGDDTHSVVGTSFDPRRQKVGNQDLLSWLTILLEPRPALEDSTFEYEGKRVVILTIPASQPAAACEVQDRGLRASRLAQRCAS